MPDMSKRYTEGRREPSPPGHESCTRPRAAAGVKQVPSAGVLNQQMRPVASRSHAAPDSAARLSRAVHRSALALAVAWVPVVLSAAPGKPLDLQRVRLELPGAPAVVVPADLNGDGRLDLTVVVAYTEHGEIGIEESSHMEGVDGLVEVLTVVSALLDRREVRAYLADGAGGYRLAGEPLALSPSVISLEAGPPSQPVLALTDEGVSVLRLSAEGALSLEPWIAEPPVLAGAGAFVPRLGLARDLDGDLVPDFLLPTSDGAAIYLARGGSLERQPASRVALPFDARLPGKAARYERGLTRHYPLPVVEDVDADGLPDLLLRDHLKRWNELQVLRGAGGGRFHPPAAPLGDRSRDAEPEVVFVGDLDGDRRAELVTEAQPNEDPEGLRAGLKEAKNPHFSYRIHALARVQEQGAKTLEAATARELQTVGYAFGSGGDGPSIPGGFQDLNGDGRLDLLTVSLDFSLMQAVRVLTVKRITLGLDFHVWCQGAGGGFQEVKGLDLSGEFKIDLDNLRLGQLSLFSGDFDGDGRSDYVQIGRGKTVTLHRGRDDCSYPSAPDFSIPLDEPPHDLALVRVEDLNGDGRADLAVTQPRPAQDDESTAPVRLDLYLSKGE